MMFPLSLFYFTNLLSVLLLGHARAWTERSICHFLHIFKLVGSCWIFHHCLIELLANELRVVNVWIQQTNILFDLLPKCLRTFLGKLFLKIFKLFPIGKWSTIDVGLKESCLAHTILKDHQANAMLKTLIPVPAVDRTIEPVHLTVANLDVNYIITLVLATGLPCEFSVSMLLVVLVLSLILVAVIVAILFPVALSVFLAIIELA